MIPPVLWHASRADIDRPTLAGRTVGDNHQNSGLGLWCAAKPARYIAGFGATIFALTLVDHPRVKRLTIRELAAMGKPLNEPGQPGSREWFEEQGRQWAQQFDVVALVESSGEVAQAIVLSDSAIVGCERMTASDFLESVATAER
jgi:hypothetical protein